MKSGPNAEGLRHGSSIGSILKLQKQMKTSAKHSRPAVTRYCFIQEDRLQKSFAHIYAVERATDFIVSCVMTGIGISFANMLVIVFYSWYIGTYLANSSNA